MKFVWLSLLLWLGAPLCWGKTVPVLTVTESINPGTADYVISQIKKADEEKVDFLVLQLDTPGGLLSSTRSIIQEMLNSKTPIVVFVSPKGARAASAGALITFASDVAAMAPGTNLGAAHPVSAGGEKMDATMANKITNDTAAFAEGLAKTRGRNTEWAVKAVRESVSVGVDEAIRLGVVDLQAENLEVLMQKLKGFSLKKPKGSSTKLPEEALTPLAIFPSIKQKLVSFFADPQLAYLILTLGGICVWIELSHPGLILPGVVGGIAILLSLISFQMLPISYGALFLIFLGLALLIAELYLPTFGVLGIGGAVAFLFGSLFLMDTNVPEFQISLGLILPTTGGLLVGIAVLSYLVLRSKKRPVQSGLEALIGKTGEIREPVSPNGSGMVLVNGELWRASTSAPEALEKGTRVLVTQVQDMLLLVVKLEKE